MKQYIFSILGIVLFFIACNEKDQDPIINLGAVPVIINPASGTLFTLDETMADELLPGAAWTNADFGYQAGITYSLQIDAAGNDFAEAITLGVTSELSLEELTQGKLNNILLAKGLPFGFENELEIRVCAKVSDLVDELCSDAVSIKVNPYQAEVVYPKLTVPGDYQLPNAWDPSDENYSVYSRRSDEVYEGYIYFGIDSAVYKYAQGLSWAVNWGDYDPIDWALDFADVGNDIPISDGYGMYFLTCDLNMLTHAQMKTDWGVLGSATSGGATTDVDFVWDETKLALTATLDLIEGGIRFRANDSDDFTFGDNFANGTLELDGDDIAISEAGNYTVDLYLTVSDYYFELTKN
ncbi:MAG: SusE domain-containing protein [Saprospiraceae bacterium]|nr:SusE domain-containing protein [Saprospiraceae bacterium]MDG1435116.1 SusE domain-containing protein [Saprospiraceae bacterium]MDG2418041.1 SusE domain-containing protein [Saprospiraceae bacterium]